MFEGRDIVVFSYSDWHATQSSPQHLARAMARANRVLFVDVPRSFLRFVKGGDSQSAGLRYIDTLEQVTPNLQVFHPPQVFLPIGGLPASLARRVLRINGRILARQLRPVLKQLEFRDLLIWNFSPLHGDAIAYLKHILVVHDICDHWSNYQKTGRAKELLEKLDCVQASEADAVFVFSEYMREKRVQYNPNTHVVLPAGDVDHYAKAALPETVVPEEITRIKKPLIGAICVIDPFRFDAKLLAHIARARPDWSICTLGPIQQGVDLSAVRGLSNVHILDNRPLAELPRYLKGFDVALIPYALNDATIGIYPMKTQEYLAAGKPVVSPRLPACKSLEEVIYFSDSHEDFVRNIERALAEDSPERIAERRAVAARNSWRDRMEERSGHVAPLLNR